MNAVEKKDAATLKTLSTDDFEMRRAADPATPVPRDEWIANELPSYALRSFRISGMAVHMFGDDTATVSMKYWQDATVGGKSRSGNFFVVDVWRKAGDSWKLAVRYVSPVESATSGTRKPTGKE
jgi:ketosteroid isomerase-like protein